MTPVLDDRGRLFGKINIIDAAIVVVLFLMIPLAYGAYLLFRVPQARLTALVPSEVRPGTTEIVVRGEHLRPYLRMTVGTQTATLLFQDPATGVLHLPELPVGVYDVVLYDEAQELARLEDGLRIESAPLSTSTESPARVPTGELIAVGWFGGLTAADAKTLSEDLRSPGSKAFAAGRIAGVRPPEPNTELLRGAPVLVRDGTYRLRAVVHLFCTVGGGECRLDNIPLEPGTSIPLPVGGRTVRFNVDELHPLYDTRVDILIRATLFSSVMASLRTGDRGELTLFPALAAIRPAVVSYEVLNEQGEGTQTVAVRVSVPAVRTRDAWLHGTSTLRVGTEFAVQTPLYEIRGPIIAVQPLGATPSAP